MTRKEAKKIQEDKLGSQNQGPFTRRKLKKLEEEIKRIHHLQREFEELKEENAWNLEGIEFNLSKVLFQEDSCTLTRHPSLLEKENQYESLKVTHVQMSTSHVTFKSTKLILVIIDFLLIRLD